MQALKNIKIDTKIPKLGTKIFEHGSKNATERAKLLIFVISLNHLNKSFPSGESVFKIKKNVLTRCHYKTIRTSSY